MAIGQGGIGLVENFLRIKKERGGGIGRRERAGSSWRGAEAYPLAVYNAHRVESARQSMYGANPYPHS